eukprot:TRINITY_DN7974_c0_g1_i2.p2 TRINITY_DN7974_c0_g1~~TRINITY_DN7974_c0_g1_i2.p2  ORF type:complete len:147 (-),score=47.42 TRINITY_DN7974_c0_g1_i2:56-496(-)
MKTTRIPKVIIQLRPSRRCFQLCKGMLQELVSYFFVTISPHCCCRKVQVKLIRGGKVVEDVEDITQDLVKFFEKKSEDDEVGEEEDEDYDGDSEDVAQPFKKLKVKTLNRELTESEFAQVFAAVDENSQDSENFLVDQSSTDDDEN